MLNFGDCSLVYLSNEDKMGIMVDDYPVLTLDRTDVPSFLDWLKNKGYPDHFLNIEIMDWLRLDSYVLTVQMVDYRICLLCVEKSNWEDFIRSLENDYYKLLENVYHPLSDLQQKYECSWEEATERLKQERTHITTYPDLPI